MRIRMRIHEGILAVRDKPSVYEVARLAGVSTATVSRVLAGHERVLPGTRDKVLTAVTELGYVPSGAARDLAARRTGVLGLCFPDLDAEDGDAAYWYDEVIRGMERAARRSGYAVLIAASHHRDDSGLVLSIAGRCDGLVVLARTAPLAMIEHVATRIPVVLLATEEGQGRTDRAIDFLAVANETGAYQVTAHLADVHGYTDLCFIAGPPDSPDSAGGSTGSGAALPGWSARCASTTAISPPRAAGKSPSGSSTPGRCRVPWCARTTRRRSGSWRRCSRRG